MEEKRKIGIVGAGPGGLTAGMILAHKGFEVTIFEKNDYPGGRNSKMQLGEYTFDVGPTFLMMKYILDEVFQEIGLKSEDYLEFIRLDPMYQLILKDKKINIFDDDEKMKDELRKFFPEDAEGFDRFMDLERKRFQRLVPCLMHDYSGFFKIFNADFIKAIPKFSLGRSLFSVLGDYYPTPEARLCFTFQSKYLGMSPWVCPGAFGMIPFIEHSMGIFHVKGGLAKISEVMADIFQKKGGTLKYGSEVKEIIFEGKRAIGLKVADGSEEKFDEIIMNADFGYAMTNLMQNKVPKYKKEKVAKKKYSCSTVMLYLGLKKKYDTQFHTIVFADDYKQNVENISKGIFSYPDFSFYMRNGSVLDKSMAPAGHCALYILIPVPNKQLAKNIDWHEAKNELRKKVLDVCKEKFGMVDIEEHIAVEKMITPDEWEMDYNVFFGATFNLAHNLGQMLWLRPHNKLECVRGVYLVGGGTHPGSGLPTIYQSARISSELICEKYGIKSEASSL